MAQIIAVARGSALQKMHYGSPLIKIMGSYCGSQSGHYRRVFGKVKVPAVAQASLCGFCLGFPVRQRSNSKADRLKPVLLKPMVCVRRTFRAARVRDEFRGRLLRYGSTRPACQVLRRHEIYCVLGDFEPCGNCFIGEAAGEHLKHFAFARCKRLGEFAKLARRTFHHWKHQVHFRRMHNDKTGRRGFQGSDQLFRCNIAWQDGADAGSDRKSVV